MSRPCLSKRARDPVHAGRGLILGLTILALCGSAASQCERRSVLEFEVNLDSAPEERFSEVAHHFNASIHAFYNKYLASVAVKGLLFGLAEKRGKENVELDGEIMGYAKLCNLPAFGLHAVQLLYELQTLMVPIHNITLPWKGPGCTGIVATDKSDGMVYHARNLDFSPAKFMQDLIYTGIFTKGGKEVFRAQMMAAYSMPLTGMKKGSNGFTFETNTRYFSEKDGNKELLKNLLEEKRELNGWAVRKVLETAVDYEAAVAAFKSVKLVATEYLIISGVRKGTILARHPDYCAYQLTLGQHNFECRADYIIVTNFDYWWHDIREWFDPTGIRGIGRPRRIAAQKILNASKVLTPAVLFSALEDTGDLAKDTIYQAIMNVEAGLYNVSLPACKECGCNKAALAEVDRKSVV